MVRMLAVVCSLAMLTLCLAVPGAGGRATACDRGPASKPSSAATNLDQSVRNWGVFCDPPGSHPRFVLANVSKPSLDGRALECSYRGGTRYTGPHCYRNLSPRRDVASLRLKLSFRFSSTTCNNQPSPSRIQALEFSVSRWNGVRRAELAAQYEVVGSGAPRWRLWDGSDWVASQPSIEQCLAPDRWHHLTLDGRITGQRVRYDAITVDGRRTALMASFAQVTDRSEPRIAVGVQADGNATSTPYRFWIDRVGLRAGRSS